MSCARRYKHAPQSTIPTMIEYRELYWYDDATYDIGFYNYYQRTIDPSPWAFIISFLFCITLVMLLPKYVTYYRSLHASEATTAKPKASERENSNIVIVGSQEFIPSDGNQEKDRDTTTIDVIFPPIEERDSSKGNAGNNNDDPTRSSQKHETSFQSIRRKTALSLNHLLHPSRKHKQKDNSLAESKTEGDLDHHSTNYTKMENGKDFINNTHGQIANSIPGKQNEAHGGGNQGSSCGELIGYRSKNGSSSASRLSETTNPLDIIKNDLKDFTGGSGPNEIMSLASGWEEEFDPISQTTVYFHPRRKQRTTTMPVDRISDDKRPWYLFYTSSSFRRKIRKCRRWDNEMKKIIGLVLPYTAHTIVVDVLGLLEVSVIGRLLGTSDLSAYFATEFAISFATMFFHGILASLKVLVSQAYGAKNMNLAGTYVQIGIWSHHLFSLPLVLFGWNNFDDIVLRLGLDEDTAESAGEYARFVLVYEAIGIYDGALHCVLDVAGHEGYSAISNGVRAFVSFLMVLSVSKWYKRPELWMVGAIHLVVKVLFIFINLCVIFFKRWLNNFWPEMVKNPFQDWLSIKTLWKASLRLSSGRVIENCEWNILFVFAAIQGPAEVAIWGLVGELWDLADDIVIAISDASKVRCAHLLGSDLPEQAKYSSEKSLFIGVVVSIIMSILFGLLQSTIPRWLTNDFTLQRLLGDMIPLISLAVSALSFGSICWSILCAQGRSHLATAVTGFGSLAIALPLGCLSNFCFNLNLQGLIACLIIGYASSGFLNSILMLTSNWHKISYKVRKRTTRIVEKLETRKESQANRRDSENIEMTKVETED